MAVLPLLAWLYLMFAHAGFWQVSRHIAAATVQEFADVRVVAVIPARDEAAVIGDTVRSLLLQQFVGSLQVIVVDDGSADGTARAALEAAQSVQSSERLRVIHGSAAAGRMDGKLWAMSQGVTAASALQPDYLLLTDADIHHDPGNLASLLSIARSGDYALVSFMVQLSVATIAEKMPDTSVCIFSSCCIHRARRRIGIQRRCSRGGLHAGAPAGVGTHRWPAEHSIAVDRRLRARARHQTLRRFDVAGVDA